MEKLVKRSVQTLFITLVAMLLMVSSCDKDDDTDEIVGTWSLEKVMISEISYSASELGMSMVINVNDDHTFTGTVITSEGTESVSGTWERIDSDTVEIYEGTDVTELKKEDDYYTVVQTEDQITMKLFLKKQ